MELTKLYELYKTQEYPHYVIYTGVEQVLIDEYINILPNKKYVKNVSQAFQSARVKGNESTTYIIIDDKDYYINENAQSIVSNFFKSSNHRLILRYNNIDKKTKFYIRNKKYIVEFNKLETDILRNMLCRRINDIKCLDNIIELCDNDYGRILLELDKIIRISNVYNCDTNTAYNTLKEQIENNSRDITFELVDSIIYGNVAKSLKLLDKAHNQDEPALRLSSLLYNGFRNILMYQGVGKDKTNLTIKTGMNSWQIKKCAELFGAYTIKEIQRNMKICEYIEQQIKTIGLDNDLALDYLVISCLN